MSNSIAPGSSAAVNVNVTALTTNPNVPVQYKTIILKKNLVNGVNTLTQEMMSAQNTKYVIKYDYVLGEDITVPANCVLEFDGGSLSNGTLNNFQNTVIVNENDSIIFNNVQTDYYNKGVCHLEWFPNDGTQFDQAIQDALRMFRSIELLNRFYYTATLGNHVKTSTKITGNGRSRIVYNGTNISLDSEWNDPTTYLFVLDSYTEDPTYIYQFNYEFSDFTIFGANENSVFNGILSKVQLRASRLMIWNCNIGIATIYPEAGNYMDGLYLTDITIWSSNAVINAHSTDNDFYNIIFSCMTNNAYLSNVITNVAMKVNDLYSLIMNGYMSNQGLYIANSYALVDNIHVEMSRKGGIILQDSAVKVTHSFIKTTYKHAITIKSDLNVGWGSTLDGSYTFEDIIFMNEGPQNNDDNYELSFQFRDTRPKLYFKNIKTGTPDDVLNYERNLANGIFIKTSDPGETAPIRNISEIFNKYSIAFCRDCCIDPSTIYTSALMCSGVYGWYPVIESTIDSDDQRDKAIKYVWFNRVFDSDRKLYFTDNQKREVAANDKGGMYLSCTYRNEISNTTMMEMMISYDDTTIVKKCVVPIRAQYFLYTGSKLGNFLINEVSIPVSSAEQRTLISWGETIPCTKNVRFQLLNNTVPQYGTFIKGDECILDNQKHIYYNGSAWVDATGATV